MGMQCLQLLSTYFLPEIFPWEHLREQPLLCCFRSHSFHPFRMYYKVNKGKDRAEHFIPHRNDRRDYIHDFFWNSCHDSIHDLFSQNRDHHELQHRLHKRASPVPNTILSHRIWHCKRYSPSSRVFCSNSCRNSTTLPFHCISDSNSDFSFYDVVPRRN